MEKRKTVNGEDILFAMTSLGFENYAEALKIYLSKYREVSKSFLCLPPSYFVAPCNQLPEHPYRHGKLINPDSVSKGGESESAGQLIRATRRSAGRNR